MELTVEGDKVPLPRSLDQSAYRIIQEALTNALRHAGDTIAHVAVRYRADRLELEVVNDSHGNRPPSDHAGGGRGLIGIQERVALFGGELEAGPRAGGGFVVRCGFPRRPADHDDCVLLADDDQLTRTGLRLIIESDPDLTVVGEGRRRP